MTVSASYIVAAYLGDGTTRGFAVFWQFYSPSDLVVTLLDQNGTAQPTPALNGSGTYDYAVSGIPDPNTGEWPGATLTTNTAPPGGWSVRVSRAIPLTQPDAFQPVGPFPAKTLESAVDRPILLLQQIGEELGRTISAPIGDPAIGPLPTALVRAGQPLIFDANGNPTVGSISPPVSAPLFGFTRASFSTTAAATVLTPAAIGSAVFLDGPAAQTLTLPPTAGLLAGDSVLVSAGTAAPAAVFCANGAALIETFPKNTLATTIGLYAGEMNIFTWTGASWRASGHSNWRLTNYALSENSGAATGARILPDGTIEQWGVGKLTAGVASITFPLAFPTTIFAWTLTVSGESGTGNFEVLATGTVTLTGMAVYGPSISGANFVWRAIGN